MLGELLARARKRWPGLRALLVTLALVVGLIDGLPFPVGVARARLPPELRELSDTLQRAQLWVLDPFRPASEELGLNQRWTLFSGAPTQRHYMWVEARPGPDAPWTLLYRPHDPEHTFLADEIEYRRVRAAWNPRRTGAPAGYTSFVSWVAGRVFDERPELSEVRVRMEKVEILPRGAGFFGKDTFVHEQRRTRGEVGR